MPKQQTTRRGFLATVAAVAALTSLEGSLPTVSADPPKRLFRGTQGVSKDRRAEELAKGIKELTPEDRQLAAKLRGIALPVVRKLVEDRAQTWVRREESAANLPVKRQILSTTAKLASGETLHVELSSEEWSGGPPERKLTVKVAGSERFLTVRGGGPMEGVRADAKERAEVDRLYDECSSGVPRR